MCSRVRICSWDVGIKNLAYCIIDWNDGEYKIVKWNIINISEEDEAICGVIQKNNKECKRKSVWENGCGELRETFCNQHKDHYTKGNILPEFLLEAMDKDKDKEKKKCSYVNKNNNECKSKGSYVFTIDELFYCTTHAKAKASSHIKNLQLTKIKKTQSYKQGLSSLGIKMVTELDMIPELLSVNEVYIENQPTLINPTMKTISAFLYQYFVIRGKVDKDSIKNIKFISPSNKLKINEDRTLEVLTKAKNEGKTYKMTKQLGIKYTLIMLNDDINNGWIEHLDKFKKKDDLCDAFLQGYYCLYKSY